MKFFLRKKHLYYLYISIFLVVLFFAINYLIVKKITLATKELNEFVAQGVLKAKHKAIKDDFTQLNNFILDAEKVIKNSSNTKKSKIKEKLTLICELAISNNNIDNGFVLFVKNNKVVDSSFLGFKNKLFAKQIIHQTFLQNTHQEIKQDTIIKIENTFYNRKAIVYPLQDEVFVVIGYDINLLTYWKYFSENYSGEGAYLTLTNSKGICMLHPEPKYIGSKVNTFFNPIAIKDILQNNNSIETDSFTKTTTTSEYLNLEVIRYFSVINIEDISLILITNFPVNLSLKKTITDVKQYVLWISILTLFTFVLLLIIVRLQLKREFSQKLKFQKEKEKLAIANEKIKQENAVLQLNQLKKKMNPHFLFNNLNSLLVLIDIDTNLSQKFVQKLADVYRYFLENRKENLITVKEELGFLEHYFFLHKIRFKNSLNIEIIKKCNENCLLKKIPFLALETLVENAIKHNEFTKENPLFIKIIITSNEIIVANNYSPRRAKNKNSYYIGLNYLKNSYQYYGVNSFKTEISNKKFNCFLPLLS